MGGVGGNNEWAMRPIFWLYASHDMIPALPSTIFLCLFLPSLYFGCFWFRFFHTIWSKEVDFLYCKIKCMYLVYLLSLSLTCYSTHHGISNWIFFFGQGIRHCNQMPISQSWELGATIHSYTIQCGMILFFLPKQCGLIRDMQFLIKEFSNF